MAAEGEIWVLVCGVLMKGMFMVNGVRDRMVEWSWRWEYLAYAMSYLAKGR